MKYVLGTLSLLAAVVIVVMSGTTLFMTAFHAATVPWQQWAAGLTIAAVVAWEAVAILVINYCFRKWHVVLGLGTAMALVLAMAVTASMEWKNWIGGRADLSVERSVKANDRDRVRNELERAYARRDKLQETERLTSYQRLELTEIKARILKLEGQWDTRTVEVHASGNVEGEAIQDLIGWNARTTQIIIDTLPMWLMMLLRVLAIPGAMVAISAMRSEKPREALQPAKAPEATETPAVATPAIIEPLPTPEPWASEVELKKLRDLADEMKAKMIGTFEDHLRDATKKVDVRKDIGQSEPISAPVSDKSEIGSNSPNSNHPEIAEQIAETANSPEVSGDVVPLEAPAVLSDTSNVTRLFKDAMPLPLVAEHPFSVDVKIKREKTTRGLGSAIQWADECTEMDEDSDTSTTMVQIWPSYASWCSQNNFHPMDKKELSRKLSAHLKIPAGRKNSKRSGAGKVFRGLIVHMPVAEKTRKIA